MDPKPNHTCRNCGSGLHPTTPCPGRDFDAAEPVCPPGKRWFPASYAEMSGVLIDEPYVAETIRKWREEK